MCFNTNAVWARMKTKLVDCYSSKQRVDMLAHCLRSNSGFLTIGCGGAGRGAILMEIEHETKREQLRFATASDGRLTVCLLLSLFALASYLQSYLLDHLRTQQ